MSKREIILDLIRRIEEKLSKKENVTLKDAVKISGFSTRYLQRIFKEEVHMNISTYIKRRRLTQAAILIRLTKKNIYHIAMELHFTTQQSFTRAFVREFKIPPLKFRANTYFDCSRLLYNYSLNSLDFYMIDTKINPIYLKATNYKFREGLLNNGLERINKFRYEAITEILMQHNKAIIITSIIPGSKAIPEVTLNARIGFADSCDYNYQTDSLHCLNITLTSNWDDYIHFGRNFFLYIGIPIPLLFIEMIEYNKAIDHKKYKINLYIPLTENIEQKNNEN